MRAFKISELKEKAQTLEERQSIHIEQVEIALRNRSIVPKSKAEMFYLLSCLNLLNSAVKQNDYKKSIPYSKIKLNVSRVLDLLLEINNAALVDDFWINEDEKCAYIVCYSFQFTFHNILISETHKNFIKSRRNIIKPWEGIKLQFIAGDLFLFAQYNLLYQK